MTLWLIGSIVLLTLGCAPMIEAPRSMAELRDRRVLIVVRNADERGKARAQQAIIAGNATGFADRDLSVLDIERNRGTLDGRPAATALMADAKRLMGPATGPFVVRKLVSSPDEDTA